jgi:mono/diheme cytochrome c family protein
MASRNSRPAVVILAVIATSTAGSQARPAQQTTPQTQPTAYRALIDQYCIGCHNETRKVGGLVLDTADLSRVADHGEIWEKVIRKLRSNAMPPEGVPRPAPAARDGFVETLEKTLDAAYARGPNPGRTETFHRLNRTEYRNAIRDLLDLDIDVSELLPADDVSFGFDNIAGVLGISPVLLERYTTAAQKVSRLAIGSSSGPATAITFRVASDLPQNDHVDGLPLGTRGGLSIDFVFPLDAHYGFDVKLARDYTDSLGPINEPHQLEVTVDGARVAVYSLTPTPGRGGRGRPDADADFNVRVPVKAGPRRVVVAFVKKTSAVTEGQRLPPIRPAIGAGGDTRHEPYVGSVTISGPFDPTGPGDTPSRRRVFVCGVGRVL